MRTFLIAAETSQFAIARGALVAMSAMALTPIVYILQWTGDPGSLKRHLRRVCPGFASFVIAEIDGLELSA